MLLFETYEKVNGFLYLWTLPGRKTYSFGTNELQAMKAKAIELNEQGNNVYFGVCGTSRKFGTYERPKQADVTFMPGFWIDVDIQGDAHKADNLPPDWEAAVSLLEGSPKPTLLVNSGYGLHAYWLFDEPWVLETDDDRKNALAASSAFQQRIKDAAKSKGWTVDATQDLSRLLRFPGTKNYKLGLENAPICNIVSTGESYPVDAFLPVEPDVIDGSNPGRVKGADAPLVQDAIKKTPAAGTADLMLNNCSFIQHCRDHASKISYDEWLAAGVNLLKAADGAEAFHAISKLDQKRYTPDDTDDKILEIDNNMRIITCQYIRETLGFSSCPADGCRGVTSPADFAENPKVRNRVIAFRHQKDPNLLENEEALTALAGCSRAAVTEFKAGMSRKISKRDLNAEVKKRWKPKVEPTLITFAEHFEKLPVDLFIPPGFSVSFENGIEFCSVDKEGEETKTNVCGELILVQRLFENSDDQSVKVELKFLKNDRWKNLTVSQSTLLNTRQIITLADYGITVSSDTARLLVKYFKAFLDCNKNKLQIIKAYRKTGWQDKEFILPHFGNQPTMDTPDGSTQRMFDGLNTAGELEDWVQLMESVRANPIGRFILSASFAAPLLHLLPCRNFLVHNWGDSRSGKTATLWAALSVWGSPEKLISSFDSTVTALERKAESFNDLPLGLDERETVNRFDNLQRILYMLANGTGRGRGTRTGGHQHLAKWRSVVLLTGEDTLLNTGSKQGAYSRVLELEGGAFTGNRTAAQKLYAELPLTYGHAGRVFLEKLLETDMAKIKRLYAMIKNWLQELSNDNLDSHIDMVACVAVADNLSSQWVFSQTPKEAGDGCFETAKTILDSLVKVKETDPALNAWEAFKGFLNQNNAQFMTDHFGKQFGYWDEGKLCVFKSVVQDFLRERQQSDRKILRDWAKHGFIESFNRGDKIRYDTTGKTFGGVRSQIIIINHLD